MTVEHAPLHIVREFDATADVVREAWRDDARFAVWAAGLARDGLEAIVVDLDDGDRSRLELRGHGDAAAWHAAFDALEALVRESALD